MAPKTARARAPALTTEPNVIPFIDVLLALLVILMATAPKPTTDLRADLPSGHATASQIAATIVDVRAAAGGFAVFVGDRQVGLDGLGALALREALAGNAQFDVAQALAQAPVYVRAEQDVAYANVIAVIENLQQARFRKVGVFALEAE